MEGFAPQREVAVAPTFQGKTIRYGDRFHSGNLLHFIEKRLEEIELLLRFIHERNVHCPRCDYNLRNLTQPVCPECREELRLTVGARRSTRSFF